MTGTNDVGNASSDPMTHAERRAAVVDEWRDRMAEGRTGARTWILLAASYLLLSGLSLLIPDWRAILAAVLLVNVAGWLTWTRLTRRDAHIDALVKLTPVVDRSILAAEVSVLDARHNALVLAMSSASCGREERRAAIVELAQAARAVMSRGGLEDRDAVVEGYPAWPEVDRTEMPGSPGDLRSVHLMRIDATMRHVMRMASSEEVVLSETIASVAGGMIPPLRALDAVESE